MVTVTTVGYGDLSPKQTLSRAITIALMLVGIGLISTLSALCVQPIVQVGGSERKEQMMQGGQKENKP